MRRLRPEEQAPWLADVLGALDQAAEEALLTEGRRHRVESGAKIPDVRECLVRVESGFLSLAVEATDRRLTLALFGPGDTVCAPLFHHWEDGIYHLRAEEESEVVLLPQAAVLRVMAENPGFAQAVLRQLSHAGWHLMRTIHMLSFFNLPQRVAQVLLNLAAIFGTPHPKGGTRLQLRFTQEELAEMAGARRETLSTVLQEFREEEILDLRYARIDIKDMAALRRVAGVPALPFLSSNGRHTI